jgi:hypothetical protein
MWKIPVSGLLYGLLCVTPLPLVAAAEVVCALGPDASSYKASADQRPTSDAMEMARRMNAALSPICSPKCPQIAIFRNPTAANAMLVVTSDQAKFVYAPQFFQTLYDNYGDGAVIAIVAHEFGHALDEINPGKFGKGGTPELRADAWAGCTIAKVDLNPTGLAEALTAVSKYPSPAHPAWPLRLVAFRLGYTQCGGDASRFDGAARR